MNLRYFLALSAACLSSVCGAVWASQNECNTKRTEDAISQRIAGAAMHEYATFNGHRIDANGRLWKFGSTETETEPLLDPATGLPEIRDGWAVAWRRVWDYWLVLDQHVAGIALSRKVIGIPGMLNDGRGIAAPREKTLQALFSALEQAPSEVRESLQQAAVRAALSDSPWSAAFISYVMHEAGFDDAQFRYSAAHWQYVQQAFGADTRRAYRACDPRHTPPNKGDLLCYSRGPLAPDNFKEWLNAVSLPGFSAASHCEIVVLVDRAASKMETVGGNVLQSVAMRRLKLNQKGVLSSTHFSRGNRDALPHACAGDKSCRQADLNAQRWSVLLQRR